jgi:hypothetical protein
MEMGDDFMGEVEFNLTAEQRARAAPAWHLRSARYDLAPIVRIFMRYS